MRWSAWWRQRRRSDEDFAAELESHIGMEMDRLIASGMPAEGARIAARRAFGNATSAREDFHESHASPLEWLVQDTRYALRAMRRSPAFTAIAVASLAIGIGANTTTFSAVDRLLLRTPAHVRDADRIHRVYFDVPAPDGSMEPVERAWYRDYVALRDHGAAFEAVGAYDRIKVSSGRGTNARTLDAVLATQSFLAMLGVRPAIGRFFEASEERDENNHVVVLGYDEWRQRYEGRDSVLGQTIDVDGLPYTIVGVAPQGFTGVDVDRVNLWLPLGAATRLFNNGPLGPTSRGYSLQIIAKLRADASLEHAATAATLVYRDAESDRPQYEPMFAKSRVILGPIVAARGPMRNADARVSVWVAAVSALVLLIACANVADLMLLRGFARARETALRLSLGATRWRIARQAIVEGMLFAAAGAVCAVLLARWSATAMQRFLMPKAESTSVLDIRLLAFTIVVAFVTGILASLVPALVTARRNFGPLLGSTRSGHGPGRLRVQRILIGGQVAVATLLLVGAGLFVTSLRNVHAIDIGIDTDHLLYVNLDETMRGPYRDPHATASINALYEAMLEQVRRVPGVAAATLTSGEPLASGWAVGVHRRGAPPLTAGTVVPFARAVGTEYFETMGTQLRRGRFFTAADRAQNAHVAIIDESVAQRYWPDRDALGDCAQMDGDDACTQIVGVVANTVLWEVTGDKGSIVYFPIEAYPNHAVTMMEIRTLRDPRASIPAIRRAISSVSPDLPWVDVQAVSDRLAPQYRPWRLGASMFSAFGALALCLAAVGLYGLLSYMVAQRTHEIGVRMALGAPRSGVIGMVVRGALGMTLVGLVAGIAIAIGAGRIVASELYGVSPRDPLVMLIGALTLVAVAGLACLAPARRATRVDPVIALRAE
jgi:putative ABC transport system permease protein